MTCKKCLYTDNIPGITFKDGLCSACQDTLKLEQDYPIDNRKIKEIVEEIKREGKGKKYDCAIGVSGGCDSSYLLHLAKKWGLRPLAVHFDNTWNSDISTMNIYKMLKKLDFDLYTYVANNELFDDMAKSMLKAGVPEIDAISDIALTSVMYMACQKHGIKYIVNGHSFRTEGFFPLGWFYFDGKYLMDIHSKFGRVKGSFPHLTFWKFLRWNLSGIKRPRLLYYMDYDKEKVKKMLVEDYGWIWYGGHHHENLWTHFHHWYNWKKFGIDSRIVECSALIRQGKMTKKEAEKIVSRPYEIDEETLEVVQKRLGLSVKQILAFPRKSHKDYKTYHSLFKRLKPFFYLMFKAGRIPFSFYKKYC